MPQDVKLLIEPIELINQRLKDSYGSQDSKANYRVVWSEDQFEHRLMNVTDEGFHLIHPEVRKVKKYRTYLKDRNILERLTVVPVFQRGELPKDVLSYEPIWVFEDPRKEDTPMPVAWRVCEFVIDNIHRNMETAGLYTKYHHPDAGLSREQFIEKRRAEIIELERYLFQDETEIGDALAHGEGVGYTTNKELKDGNTQ